MNNALGLNCGESAIDNRAQPAPAKCPESGLQSWFKSTLGALTSQFCNNPLWQCELNSRPSCCNISTKKKHRRKRTSKSMKDQSCLENQGVTMEKKAEEFIEEMMSCLPSDLDVGEAAGKFMGEFCELHECVMSIVQEVFCSLVCSIQPDDKNTKRYPMSSKSF